jgi:hypothetical protein
LSSGEAKRIACVGTCPEIGLEIASLGKCLNGIFSLFFNSSATPRPLDCVAGISAGYVRPGSGHRSVECGG